MTARPSVVVLDYGSGNVHSAVKALELAGADVVLTGDCKAAQAAALGALAHADEMLAMVGEIRAQRDRLVVELAELGYLPHRSGSNFVLFGGVDDPHAVFEALLERGVLIRDVGIPHHLRVTAGTEIETTAFLEALRALGRPSGAVAAGAQSVSSQSVSSQS